MTPKQEERIRNKIRKIKAALAADKRAWGGEYHDGQRLRYLPPELYIKIGDYTGGLRYVNWFNKNFPDDRGFPDFLFQWTIILYKTGRKKEAEKKAFEAFCGNTYLFDKFFGKPISTEVKWEGSNLENAGFAEEYFNYSHQQEALTDFADWLKNLISTGKFSTACRKFIQIRRQLEDERDVKIRRKLVEQEGQLENEI